MQGAWYVIFPVPVGIKINFTSEFARAAEARVETMERNIVVYLATR